MIRNFLQMHTKYDSYFLTSDSAELQMFVVKNKEYKALFSWPIKHVNTFRWMVNKNISLPHLIKQIITHSSIGRFSKTTEPPPLIWVFLSNFVITRGGKLRKIKWFSHNELQFLSKKHHNSLVLKFSVPTLWWTEKSMLMQIFYIIFSAIWLLFIPS